MARRAITPYREKWYERRLEQAETPKDEFEVLRSQFAASVKKLPAELHDGTYQQAVSALRGVIEAVEDALEDIGRRPAGTRP